MNSVKLQRWKHYLPAVFFFLLGVFFYSFPGLTVFLVVSFFTGIGILYTMIIRRMHQVQDSHQTSHMNGFEKDIYESGEPNFKNITVTVLKRGNLNRFL